MSVLLGLDEKWLSAAREGRKGLNGTPYKKLGNGKTSLIRYPIDTLIIWMESFPLKSGTTSHFSSFASFQNTGSSIDVWPFVHYDNGAVDEIFISINCGKFTKNYRTRLIIWLAKSYIPQQDSLCL